MYKNERKRATAMATAQKKKLVNKSVTAFVINFFEDVVFHIFCKLISVVFCFP